MQYMAMTYLTKLKPEPMGEYSLSTAYGVNSLVMSEDGAAAYISVKDVPAGTPLTNTDYWKIHTDLTAVRQSAEAAAQKANAARDEMLEIARNLTDMVEKSGNPVQAELVGGLPFDRVETVLEPIQPGSGDPSPSNIRPISGWTGAKLTRCGKNLIPSISVETLTNNGITFSKNTDGTVAVNGTSTGYTSAQGAQIDAVNLRGKTVTLKGANAPGILVTQMYIQCESGNIYKSCSNGNDAMLTFSIPEDANTMRWEVYLPAGKTVSNLVIYPQLELGSAATVYEPYQGNTYTADFGQTVYGGTLDWQTGVLTVDCGLMSLDGTENWGYHTNGFFYMNFSVYARSDKDRVIASHYPQNDFNTGANGVAIVSTGTYYNQIRIYGTGYTDVNVWKSYLAAQYAAGTPVQVCYKLATPTTIQLTPQEIKQLQGVNTLYGDGSISMTGRADKALALEARIAALEAAG